MCAVLTLCSGTANAESALPTLSPTLPRPGAIAWIKAKNSTSSPTLANLSVMPDKSGRLTNVLAFSNILGGIRTADSALAIPPQTLLRLPACALIPSRSMMLTPTPASLVDLTSSLMPPRLAASAEVDTCLMPKISVCQPSPSVPLWKSTTLPLTLATASLDTRDSAQDLASIDVLRMKNGLAQSVSARLVLLDSTDSPAELAPLAPPPTKKEINASVMTLTQSSFPTLLSARFALSTLLPRPMTLSVFAMLAGPRMDPTVCLSARAMPLPTTMAPVNAITAIIWTTKSVKFSQSALLEPSGTRLLWPASVMLTRLT